VKKDRAYNKWTTGGACACRLLVATVVLTSPGGNTLAAYDSTDLVGTWYIDSLTGRDPNSSRWWFGPITVESNALYRGTVLMRFQTEPNIMRDYR
jgi:hypothetical protein